jgi:hypothetical protein
MGRSQVVRQRILIPPYGGSNPPAPANNFNGLEQRRPSTTVIGVLPGYHAGEDGSCDMGTLIDGSAPQGKETTTRQRHDRGEPWSAPARAHDRAALRPSHPLACRPHDPRYHAETRARRAELYCAPPTNPSDSARPEQAGDHVCCKQQSAGLSTTRRVPRPSRRASGPLPTPGGAL